jgi:oligoendopeptidase F
LEKLGYHERNLEYGTLSGEYSYDFSVDLIDQVTASLHPEFNREFRDFVEQGRISVMPKSGKTAVAFCSYTYGNYAPALVLLNYTSTLRDITTFAHEIGHGINHQLIYKNQSPVNRKISFFTGETASTFLEDFVVQKLEETMKTDEEKLTLLMTRLNDSISTIFRQTACENLQRELNITYRNEGFLSTEKINALMKKHMIAYMGDAVSQDDGTDLWWVYWSHIRGYSLYSYVAGLLLAKSMQNLYKQDNSNIEKIVEWYGTGSNSSPHERFLKLGVDIGDSGFWLKGLDEVDSMLKEAEDLAKKLNA